MDTEKEQKPSSFYVAVAVYESTSDSVDKALLYEETFTLLVAASEEDAERQAVQLVQEPFSYKNQYGETITWSLKQRVVVRQVVDDKLVHGTEIFARFFRNYEAYHLAFLNYKAEEADIE